MFDRIRSESLKKQLLDTLGTIVSHYVKHIRDLLRFLLSNHKHRTYLSGSLKSCDSLLRKKMESPQTLNEELDNITTNKKAFLKQYRTVLYNINSNQPTRFGRRRRPNRVLVALRLGSVFYSILFCSSMKDKILTVIWTSGKNTESNLLKETF